ncbi:MAG TPA: hypothetical protein PK990_02515 [Salinivirgaceae bacterium]|nr:hypothetical protein [Salinivirgaceae bacterium]
MHIEAIKAIIERDLSDLKQIVDDIEVGHTISKIEAHLLKAKVESLTNEMAKLFESINNSAIEKPLMVDSITRTTVESPINETRATGHSTPAGSISTEINKSNEKTILPKVDVAQKRTEKPSEDNSHVEAKETNSSPEKEISEVQTGSAFSQKIPEPLATSPKVTIADKFTDSNRSLNDRIGESKALIDRASMLSRKPISDIHKAIKVNDRVAFLRELFNGDLQKYQQTIDQINQMRDFDEALNFIHQNFTWDQTSETFKSFIEIVYRRFMN